MLATGQAKPLVCWCAEKATGNLFSLSQPSPAPASPQCRLQAFHLHGSSRESNAEDEVAFLRGAKPFPVLPWLERHPESAEFMEEGCWQPGSSETLANRPAPVDRSGARPTDARSWWWVDGHVEPIVGCRSRRSRKEQFDCPPMQAIHPYSQSASQPSTQASPTPRACSVRRSRKIFL